MYLSKAGPVAIPPRRKPVPLAFPVDKRAAEGKEMWEEAKRQYEKCLRINGVPPKWELLMRDPRFAAAVKAEDDRIREQAADELALRRAKEAALMKKISAERTAEELERKRKESADRVERIRQFNLFRIERDGSVSQSMNPKEELKALGAPKNPNTGDGWMYHMTSYENLIGVRTTGLNPKMGGNLTGACGLALNHTGKLPKGVKDVKALQKESIQHSRNRVAATNNRLAMATYTNQRENAADLVPGQPIGNYAVQLRFRNRYSGGQEWIKDPMDARARLLEGTSIPVQDIECLTTSGWVPLASIDGEVLRFVVEEGKKRNFRHTD